MRLTAHISVPLSQNHQASMKYMYHELTIQKSCSCLTISKCTQLLQHNNEDLFAWLKLFTSVRLLHERVEIFDSI